MPKIMIETPINKFNHENIVNPEISEKLILKSSNIPFQRNIIPNTRCIIDKVHIFFNVSNPLNFCVKI